MEENRNVNNVPAEGNEDSINFSIHDLIQMVIGNWFWFLLSTVVCLSCALFYIYTAPKVYNRTATILIKDGKKGSETDIAAFGDTYNDIPMLDIIGHSYVMANAAEHMHAHGKFLAPSNNEAGVLTVIDRIIEAMA